MVTLFDIPPQPSLQREGVFLRRITLKILSFPFGGFQKKTRQVKNLTGYISRQVFVTAARYYYCYLN